MRGFANTRITHRILNSLAMLMAVIPSSLAEDGKPQRSPYRPVLPAEAKSEALCESLANRVFVSTKWGSECLSYFVTQGHDSRREAVVVFDGDVSAESYANPQAMEQTLATARKALQNWADKLKTRYVLVSRVGVNGSSGNHAERRRPRETHIMNSAIDSLKQKLALDRIALAGQSGGSTISASLLSLGRNDVACAALGSGAFELVDLEYKELIRRGSNISKTALAKTIYDPSTHTADIPTDASRRIFVIGDTSDTRTPYDQQKRYAEALQAAGHHAILIAIEAAGELDHSAISYAIPTAGGCLRGAADAQLIKANSNQSHRIQTKETAAAAAPAGKAAGSKSTFHSAR